MRIFGFCAIVLIFISLVLSGCVYDPTGVVLGKNAEPRLSGTPVPASTATMVSPVSTPTTPSSGVAIPPVLTITKQTQAPASGTSWILWREIPLDEPKGWTYSMNRPNLDQRYFRNLKVELSADAPVNVRFVTLKQYDAYMEEYSKVYEYRTSPSFNRDSVGYVKFFQAVTDTSVEAHGTEEIVFFLEPFSNMPVKGTMKVYYQP
ncbi:MAG: hypothetical protein Q7U51_06075 [Methanoregula sp.]|nr:hypothetical protein [Methanoregula sp.]